MTDKLISDLGSIGAAIADTTAFEAQRNGQTTTEQALGSDLKAYVKSWIAKADVGLGNVDNTSDATKNAAAVTLTNKTMTAPVINSPTGIVKGDVGLGNVTNNAQLTIANNLSDVADPTASRTNLLVSYGQERNRFYAFTDCVNAASGYNSDHFAPAFSGTGAQPSSIAGLSAVGVGFITMNLGTTTTGRAAISDNGGGSAPIKFGSGTAKFCSRAAIHVLSNGTDTYTTRVGFIDSLTAESTDGAFFRYTDGVNSGKWQAVTRSNGTETATDTGVTPVADTFQRFEVSVNAAGTSVTFTIDGANTVTTSTNIPTGAGRETGYGVMGLKSAGTTATSAAYVDYIEVEYLFTTPR